MNGRSAPVESFTTNGRFHAARTCSETRQMCMAIYADGLFAVSCLRGSGGNIDPWWTKADSSFQFSNATVKNGKLVQMEGHSPHLPNLQPFKTELKSESVIQDGWRIFLGDLITTAAAANVHLYDTRSGCFLKGQAPDLSAFPWPVAKVLGMEPFFNFALIGRLIRDNSPTLTRGSYLSMLTLPSRSTRDAELCSQPHCAMGSMLNFSNLKGDKGLGPTAPLTLVKLAFTICPTTKILVGLQVLFLQTNIRTRTFLKQPGKCLEVGFRAWFSKTTKFQMVL